MAAPAGSRIQSAGCSLEGHPETPPTAVVMITGMFRVAGFAFKRALTESVVELF